MKIIYILLILYTSIFAKELTFTEKTYKSLKKANTLIKQKNYDKAIQALQAIDTKKKQEQAYIENMIANIYLNKKEYKQAIIYLNKALNKNVFEENIQEQVLYNLLQAYIITKNCDKASNILSKYNKLAKKINSELYASMSYCYIKTNNYKNALSFIKLALEKDSLNANYIQILLSIYSHTNNNTQLCATLETAYKLKILQSSYIKQLAYCLYKKGAPLRGANILESSIKNKSLKSSNKNNEFLFNLLLEAKEYKRAYKMAQILHNDTLSLNIIQTFFNTGMYNETIQAVNTLSKKLNEKNFYLATFIKAEAYYYLDKKDKALQIFKQCLKSPSTEELAQQWITYISK